MPYDNGLNEYRKIFKVGDIVYITHALTEEEACEIDKLVGLHINDRYWVRDMDQYVGQVFKIESFSHSWNPIYLSTIDNKERFTYRFPPQCLAKCSITLE